MNEPLVTVATPVYNVKPYLEECVKSITAQTHTNLEIILVDDGSTDGSGILCDDLAVQDSRIAVIHKSNGGVSAARNSALDSAHGEWIAFVDSDDVLEPWHIATLLSAARESEAEVALGGYRTLRGSALGQLVVPAETRSTVPARRALEMLLYQEGVDTAPWSKLFRADRLEGVRFPPLPSSEDLATVYKPLLKSKKVAIVKDSGYRYRVIEGSLSSSRQEEASWRVAREIAGDILKTYPDLRKACSCRRLSFAFHVMEQAKDPSVVSKLWREVVATRGCVLRDRRARNKARAAALVSYAGRGVAIAIMRRNNEANGKDKDR